MCVYIYIYICNIYIYIYVYDLIPFTSLARRAASAASLLAASVWRVAADSCSSDAALASRNAASAREEDV